MLLICFFELRSESIGALLSLHGLTSFIFLNRICNNKYLHIWIYLFICRHLLLFFLLLLSFIFLFYLHNKLAYVYTGSAIVTMTDVLSWLYFAREKALSEVMSSQKERILPFLLGDTYVPEGFPESKKKTNRGDKNCSSKSSAGGPQSFSHWLPRLCTSSTGASMHGLIPLAIVEELMFSGSTTSVIPLLRKHFLTRSEVRLVTKKSTCGYKAEECVNANVNFQQEVEVEQERRRKIHFDEMFTVHVNGGKQENNFLVDGSRQACLESLEEYLDVLIQKARNQMKYRAPARESEVNLSSWHDHRSRNVRALGNHVYLDKEENKRQKGSTFYGSLKLGEHKASDPTGKKEDNGGNCNKMQRKRWRENAEEEACCNERENAVYDPSHTASHHIKVHRLLIVVCCSFCFPQSVSSSTGLPSSSFREVADYATRYPNGANARYDAAPSTSLRRSLSSGRNRYYHLGSDPLYLVLSDLAALLNRTRAKLSTFSQLGCPSSGRGTRMHRSKVPHYSTPAKHYQVHFGVLLILEDDVYGIAKLAQRLNPLFGSEFLIRCFDRTCLEVTVESPLSCLRFSQERKQKKNDMLKARKIQVSYNTNFIHLILRIWEPEAIPFPSLAHEGTKDENTSSFVMVDAYLQKVRLLVVADSRFFFLRPNNLVLAWFLWHSLQLFPVLLFPSWLESIQRLWASRHSLDDIVHAFHSLLMPFHFSTERCVSRRGCPVYPIEVEEREKVAALLDALYAAASDLSMQLFSKTPFPSCVPPEFLPIPSYSGMNHFSSSFLPQDYPFQLNDTSQEPFFFTSHVEAVFFLLLYEDLIRCHCSRLLEFPRIVRCLAAFSPKHWRRDECFAIEEGLGAKSEYKDDEKKLYNIASEVLACGMLPFLHESSIAFSSSDSSGEPTPFLLPQYIMLQYGALAPSVVQQLQRAALFCALPPFFSLEQLHATLHYSPSDSSVPLFSSVSSAPYLPLRKLQGAGISSNNFFHPLLPPEIRLLHLMTTHSLKMLYPKSSSSSPRGVRRRNENVKEALLFVPLSRLQWASGLTDVSLLSALEVLRSSGLITISPSDVTARSTLVVNPYSSP